MTDDTRAVSPDGSSHELAQRQLCHGAGIPSQPGDPSRARAEHCEIIKAWGRVNGWPVLKDASTVSAELLLTYRLAHDTARRTSGRRPQPECTVRPE